MVDLKKKYLYRMIHIDNISHVLEYGITHRNSTNANRNFIAIGDSSIITTRTGKVLKNGKTENLKEWALQEDGTIQYFKELLAINDIEKISRFMECYFKVLKPSRNDKCYCGSGVKLKKCHLNTVKILRSTSKKELQK